MLSEDVTGQVKPGWRPFNDYLSPAQRSFASELRDVRNTWAHGGAFSADGTYRALDTAERLLRAVDAVEAADQAEALRKDLRRVTAEDDDRRVVKSTTVQSGSHDLRSWREVLAPHDDVATGNFRASEFAADLYKVATGDPGQSQEYANPIEFFRRTYLTEGLRDLIGRALARLDGDMNASPVVNLQTNFGGGKTHSMLSLWHLAAGIAVQGYPQEVQELLTARPVQGLLTEDTKIRRVALVGNHVAPSGSTKPDGTKVNTLWGELTWQLGGRHAYDLVADADRSSTAPGQALHTLLAAYAPAVVLIDEWVAYARQLYDRDDLAGGTFDTQFTFAQSLTEAVKATPGVFVASPSRRPTTRPTASRPAAAPRRSAAPTVARPCAGCRTSCAAWPTSGSPRRRRRRTRSCAAGCSSSPTPLLCVGLPQARRRGDPAPRGRTRCRRQTAAGDRGDRVWRLRRRQGAYGRGERRTLKFDQSGFESD